MSSCNQCEACIPHPVQHIDLSESTDYSDSGEDWEGKLITLKPTESYEKPFGRRLMLTNVSMISTFPTDNNEKGILTAITNDGNIILASLPPTSPSQSLNLAWNESQEVVFLNDGNRIITINMIITC